MSFLRLLSCNFFLLFGSKCFFLFALKCEIDHFLLNVKWIICSAMWNRWFTLKCEMDDFFSTMKWIIFSYIYCFFFILTSWKFHASCVPNYCLLLPFLFFICYFFSLGGREDGWSWILDPVLAYIHCPVVIVRLTIYVNIIYL